ncbi:complex I subunit 5 family protein [sulfur-oxidizing endosymbiont of Gigantopelta aegis]|uniref:complex I subunit 5 family protein n=1 Tax=sulfur-oxidizing endosymbiont of Gigantopelta aegis TaxID=2794934 RepID=UPI0018DC5746|nr:proton-conducting transporter membrane subunit [sulfur-oxidizing endosymbiont of Gigantopelta aegis]
MTNITLFVVLPLLAAFLMPVIARFSQVLARTAGLSVLVLSILIVLSQWGNVDTKAVAFTIGGYQPPMGIVFYVDQLSLLFALLIPVMVLLFWPWNRVTHIREYSLMMLLTASASGLVLSGDLFNIYVFYELMAVASYGLVASSNASTRLSSGATIAAAFRYLLLGSVGSVMFLLGIAIIYTQTGTLNLAHLALLAPEKLNNLIGLSAFALILVGVGVKAELFPVNSWVPEVYGSISTRLASLMAGLLSKLAVIVIVRLLILIFPQPEALQLMAILGILGVLTGELVAWRAKDLIRMLSFSSIGQLGLIFLAFSIPGEMGLMAGLALVFHHMLVKPALFMLAESWSGPLDNLVGLAKRSPISVALFVLLILSMLGVPPLPGFWAKYLLMLGLSAQADSIYSFAMMVVPLAMVIEVSYLFRVVNILYKKPCANTPTANERGLKVQRAMDFNIALAVGFVLLLITIQLPATSDKLSSLAKQTGDREHYIQTVFPGSALTGKIQ